MSSYQEKIEQYASLIKKWNKTHNLISRADIDNVKERHIADSEQLIKYIPNGTKTLCDLGSGGGLPAVVIALDSLKKSSEITVSAIESNLKKSVFLRNVRRELELENFNPISERIENVDIGIQDVITARAFASLTDIFEISKKLYDEKTNFILLKGNSIKEEITEAESKFKFSYTTHKSNTGDGFIFISSNVKSR